MSGSSAGDGVICPACEAENPAGSRFCERCGTRLPPRQREAEGGATVTFQRLPDDFAARPAAEPHVPEPEPFERTLIGTPPIGDAALPGGFPAAITPADESAAAERSVRPEPVPSPAPPAPATSAPPQSPPESARDRPTMTFQLPDLAPPSSESRSAPTVSFQLPDLTTPAPPSGASPADDREPGEAPAARSVQEGGGDWSYQTWRPDPSANQAAGQAAPPADGVGPGGTRRSIDLGGVAPWPNAPLSSEAMPPPAPPARREDAAPIGSPAGYPPAPTPQYPGGRGSPAWTPPGNAPGMSYPGQGLGQAPPAPNYGPPPGQMAYPTPSERGNNRARWIILGIVGALLILCVLGCVVLFVIGAITGAASSSAVATAVPTITR